MEFFQNSIFIKQFGESVAAGLVAHCLRKLLHVSTIFSVLPSFPLRKVTVLPEANVIEYPIPSLRSATLTTQSRPRTAATNACSAEMFPFIIRHCCSNAVTLDSSPSMSLRTAESSYLPQEENRISVNNITAVYFIITQIIHDKTYNQYIYY